VFQADPLGLGDQADVAAGLLRDNSALNLRVNKQLNMIAVA
jgi:hypothetical protein